LLAGPVAWLLHGLVHHGDATFFVKKVAAYRQAIGASPTHTFEALTAFPLRLVRCEPELAGATLVLLFTWVVAVRRGPRRALLSALAVLAVVPFLVLGDLRDGAPTHHSERALLPVWLGFALFLASAPRWLPRPWWRGTGLAVAAAVLLGAYPLRPWYARLDDFIDRRAEVAIGAEARRLGAERLLIASYDFGYFAVMVGAGGPNHATPFDDRDPRKPRPPSAFTSTGALRARLAAAGTRWFVTSKAEDARVATNVGQRRAERERLVLWEVGATNQADGAR
jgi:hypothetical protein